MHRNEIFLVEIEPTGLVCYVYSHRAVSVFRFFRAFKRCCGEELDKGTDVDLGIVLVERKHVYHSIYNVTLQPRLQINCMYTVVTPLSCIIMYPVI